MTRYVAGPTGLLVPQAPGLALLSPPAAPAGHVNTGGRGVFLDLHVDGQLPRVVAAIVKAVEASFVARPMRERTKREEKDRAARCLRLVGIMRGDLKMPVARAVDALPRALLDDLDGLDFAQSSRRMWAADEE